MTLVDALIALGLPPTLDAPLSAFARLFLKWNQRINLSSARTEQELQDHLVDCLHLVPHLRALAAPSHPPRFLDVGSGGGLPAVIAAICLLAAHITALEPIHHARSDYTAARSRATFDLADWLRLGITRVEPGGVVFGFEAALRSDLPSSIRRHPYAYLGKTRAIVALQRPSSPADSP